jgi:hypothetical protein
LSGRECSQTSLGVWKKSAVVYQGAESGMVAVMHQSQNSESNIKAAEGEEYK